MAYASDVTSSEIRLDFFYDLQQREFIIRFESRSQTAAYQTKNNEARIFDDRRYEAWLPMAREMRYLRSSSLGMAVVFDSEDSAKKWRDKSVLGDLVTFDRGVHGVFFNRSWTQAKLRERIGDFRQSLVVPYPTGDGVTRPVSREGRPTPERTGIDVGVIDVAATRQSERAVW